MTKGNATNVLASGSKVKILLIYFIEREKKIFLLKVKQYEVQNWAWFASRAFSSFLWNIWYRFGGTLVPIAIKFTQGVV
jgi:hypothetical protein